MTQKETSSLGKQRARGKEVIPLEEGYTSYGYLGLVNGRLIEVASPEELYELLEDSE